MAYDGNDPTCLVGEEVNFGWLPIRYRDFYDIPRAVVTDRCGRLYLFDCLFDHSRDDYEEKYEVYLLPEDLRDRLDGMSWTDLRHQGEFIGSVSTNSVEFDQTRRHAIRDTIFREIDLP